MEDTFDNEYKHYWETNMFLQSEELTSFLDEAVAASAYYDLSSPDGPHSSKNIVSERNRRKKLNERLYALRAVVPNITKMDKASIVKDAIEHIKSLHDEESRIEAEIAELETGRASPSDGDIFCCDDQLPERTMKRARLVVLPSPIEVLELRVCSMGEKTLVVSVTCSKGSDTAVRLCEVFESLKLNIITANITSFSGKLFKTVFLEGEDEEEILRLKVEDAIAALNGPDSPINGPGSADSS